MERIVFEEMRKSIEQIRAIDPKEKGADGVYPLSDNDKMLFDTISLILKCAKIARDDGLLSIEQLTEEMDDLPGGKYLQYMILLVVDGNEQDYIEDICLTRYFSSKLKDYGALQYLIMMVGILRVRNLEHRFHIEEKLKYMLPEELTEEYDRQNNEKDWLDEELGLESGEEVDMSAVEQACEEEPVMEAADEYHEIVMKLDGYIDAFDDRTIQRILRDVDNDCLKKAMKVMSRQNRRKLFNNLGRKLAVLMAEEMIRLRTIEAVEAGQAAEGFLMVILKLAEACEISLGEDDDGVVCNG